MDEQLRTELLEMEQRDLTVRTELVERGELHNRGYHPEMQAVHERHNKRLSDILDVHGWPGKSLVGEDGCNAAWLVVQHALHAARCLFVRIGWWAFEAAVALSFLRRQSFLR